MTETNIRTRLLAVQTELSVPKNQYNKFGKYNYRNCEDILEAAKPLCLQHGLLLVVSDEIVCIGEYNYVKASSTVRSIDNSSEFITVYAYAREPRDQKGMNDSQMTGSASSYSRKYSLNGLFCIDDTKDADTMDNRKPEPKKPEVIDETFAAKLCDSMLATETMAELDAKWKELEPYAMKKNKVTQVLCNTHYLNRKKALEG